MRRRSSTEKVVSRSEPFILFGERFCQLIGKLRRQFFLYGL
jgi:hypothetical protein